MTSPVAIVPALAITAAIIASCDHQARDLPGKSTPEGAAMTTSPLTLTARADATTFRRGASIPIVLTLANTSTTPLWVNRRIGVGYQDSLFREVYFTVTDAVTGAVVPVADKDRADAHRLPPSRADFAELAPGAMRSERIDLAIWFRFPRAGRYRVAFTYHNDADGAEHELRAFTGVVAAAPIELAITD
jgi:hypothetical protein